MTMTQSFEHLLIRYIATFSINVPSYSFDNCPQHIAAQVPQLLLIVNLLVHCPLHHQHKFVDQLLLPLDRIIIGCKAELIEFSYHFLFFGSLLLASHHLSCPLSNHFRFVVLQDSFSLKHDSIDTF